MSVSYPKQLFIHYYIPLQLNRHIHFKINILPRIKIQGIFRIICSTPSEVTCSEKLEVIRYLVLPMQNLMWCNQCRLHSPHTNELSKAPSESSCKEKRLPQEWSETQLLEPQHPRQDTAQELPRYCKVYQKTRSTNSFKWTSYRPKKTSVSTRAG